MKNLFALFFVLLSPYFATGQSMIFGQVLDTNGIPLPEVKIELLENGKATLTDADGFYSLKYLEDGSWTVKTYYLGYESSQETIELAGRKNVDFTLLESIEYTIPAINVTSNRATSNTPMTYSNIAKKELEERNLGQDVPFLLRFTPSAVVTSDAGTGIGYTGIRLRGSDQSRINVTVNGIPLNDSESQQVFWVNMPDFLSSTEDIQIQRGVGTSTNGAAAFGGTIDLNTKKIRSDPYAIINGSYGSFNTRKANIQFGSGLLKEKFTLDARVSKINSDGYVDRATSDLMSWFVSGGYLGKKNSLTLNVFSGHEVTYQAWYGLPSQYYEGDSLLTTNVAGKIEDDRYHNNQVDDYQQTHYQALYTHQIGDRISLDAKLHYTRGQGFFEEYKIGQDLSKYAITPDDPNLIESDLVRKRWLDNDFYGTILSLNYRPNEKIGLTSGGAWSNYKGDHFGEVIWYNDIDVAEPANYYDNDAEKMEFSFFTKVNYQLSEKWTSYLDLQYRNISYDFFGFDNDGTNVTQNVSLGFFNPKAGMLYSLNKNTKLYASFAVANHEPNRSDFTESSINSRPKSEQLFNTEIGVQRNWEKGGLSANAYHMLYKDQLVLTGQINDVGEYSRRNVDDSYRLGLELVANTQVYKGVAIAANATFSQNKITALTEYIDNWDTGEQEAIEHKDTDLAFSPNVIVGADLKYDFSINNVLGKKHGLTISLLNKYVSKQYIDATSNKNTVLNPYFFSDLRLRYVLKTIPVKEIALTFLVRNLWDQKYATNAWTYRYSSTYDARGDDANTRYEGNLGASQNVYNQTGFFPQAGRNFLVGLSLTF